MRYFKGNIQLSPQHDYPLLKRVLYCGFVMHYQLWEFMLLDGSETRRDCFGWRVKRLVDHGFLNRYTLPGFAGSFVYSLTAVGGSSLIGLGPLCPGAAAFFDRKQDLERIHHAIELNRIHLALLRSALLRRWMSDLEIRTRNEMTGCGYMKDYDAVMTLLIAGEETQIALEYERHAKAESRYLDIAERIRAETRIEHFLYLVADWDLLLFVRRFFERTARRIYFGLALEFEREILGTRVVDSSSDFTRLGSLLMKSPLTQ